MESYSYIKGTKLWKSVVIVFIFKLRIPFLIRSHKINKYTINIPIKIFQNGYYVMLVSRTWNNTLSIFHIFNTGVSSTCWCQQRRIFRVNKIYNHFLISDVLFCVRFFHHQTINAEVIRQGQSNRGRRPTKFFLQRHYTSELGAPFPFMLYATLLEIQCYVQALFLHSVCTGNWSTEKPYKFAVREMLSRGQKILSISASKLVCYDAPSTRYMSMMMLETFFVRKTF